MNSRNITDTQSRLLTGMNSIIQDVYDNQNVGLQIQNAVEESMITTGTMTKYYPSLNKCEVQLDKSNKKVICKNLLMFNGSLILLYTPDGEPSFCERLKEPCIIPQSKLSVLVVNINNDDDEYLMLGYYLKNDLLYLNPSKRGNFKILVPGAVNEYSIRFGLDGLKVVTNGSIVREELDTWGTNTTKEVYNKDDVDKLLVETKEAVEGEVYSKSEVYNKSEIDDIVDDIDTNYALKTDVPSANIVYNCNSWNNTYVDSGASRKLTIYQYGELYMLQYFITTNTLTYSDRNYNMNDDTIPSEYRPSSNLTFHISTSSSHNAKITITSGGKIQISTDTDSTSISFAGTVSWIVPSG